MEYDRLTQGSRGVRDPRGLPVVMGRIGLKVVLDGAGIDGLRMKGNAGKGECQERHNYAHKI
jgi:hypothetical protein